MSAGNNRSQRGTSLIELVLAISLLALISTLLLRQLAQQSRHHSQLIWLQQSQFIADNLMHELQALPYLHPGDDRQAWLCRPLSSPARALCDFQDFDSLHGTPASSWLAAQLQQLPGLRVQVSLNRHGPDLPEQLPSFALKPDCPLATQIVITVHGQLGQVANLRTWRYSAQDRCP